MCIFTPAQKIFHAGETAIDWGVSRAAAQRTTGLHTSGEGDGMIGADTEFLRIQSPVNRPGHCFPWFVCFADAPCCLAVSPNASVRQGMGGATQPRSPPSPQVRSSRQGILSLTTSFFSISPALFFNYLNCNNFMKLKSPCELLY